MEPLIASFCIYDPETPECYDERSIASDFDRLKDALVGQGPHQGSLVITRGSDEIRITDEMWWIVDGLCIKGTKRLQEGSTCVHAYFETDAFVVMIPVGDTLVHLLGDKIAPFRAQKDPLVRELQACGERYMALLEKVSDDADHAAELEALRKTAAGHLQVREQGG